MEGLRKVVSAEFQMSCLQVLSKEFEKGEGKFELEKGNVKAMKSLPYQISKGLNIGVLWGRDQSMTRSESRSLVQSKWT